MANKEQVKILEQGVEIWNKRRSSEAYLYEADLYQTLYPTDLSKADLSRANLIGADLGGADLSRANLSGANLRGANLRGADLSRANLNGAYLRGTYLSGANLREANLIRADLSRAEISETDLNKADLSSVDLSEALLDSANLSSANLSRANLIKANLTRANLTSANLSGAGIGGTTFGETDLSETIGLDEVIHILPSTIGTDTLQLSKGKISTVFLRSCGLSDFEIESAKLYNPDLSNHEIDDILHKIHELRARQPVQVSPIFISYCHADAAFVDRLEEALNEKGIRFWRDIHDAKAGRLEKQIEQAIRHNPTVLVVLSKNSTQSDWVEHEVRTARGLEKELKRDVLCPVALDDSWKTASWPERVMEQVMEYNILDFSKWQKEGEFEKMFKKLIDGLDLFYKK